MAAFRHEIFIALLVEVVFAAIADVTTHPRWQEGLLQTEEAPREPPHVGARGVEVRRLFRCMLRFPYEITDYDPQQVWGSRALTGPIRPAAVLSFRSHNSGTLVESKLTIPGLPGLLLGRMVEIPGLTQEQYEAAAAIINQGGPQVGGALVHAAGPFDGGCRVVEVWESQEQADAFYQSALFGQIASQMPQPKITSWPLWAFDGAGLK